MCPCIQWMHRHKSSHYNEPAIHHKMLEATDCRLIWQKKLNCVLVIIDIMVMQSIKMTTVQKKWNCFFSRQSNRKDFNLDCFQFQLKLGCSACAKWLNSFINCFTCGWLDSRHWLVWPVTCLASFQRSNAPCEHQSVCRRGSRRPLNSGWQHSCRGSCVTSLAWRWHVK